MRPKAEKKKRAKAEPYTTRTCMDCLHREACTMWVGVNRISCCDAVKCECFRRGECEG